MSLDFYKYIFYGRFRLFDLLTFNQVVRGSNPRTLIYRAGEVLRLFSYIKKSKEKAGTLCHRLRKEENIY